MVYDNTPFISQTGVRIDIILPGGGNKIARLARCRYEISYRFRRGYSKHLQNGNNTIVVDEAANRRLQRSCGEHTEHLRLSRTSRYRFMFENLDYYLWQLSYRGRRGAQARILSASRAIPTVHERGVELITLACVTLWTRWREQQSKLVGETATIAVKEYKAENDNEESKVHLRPATSATQQITHSCLLSLASGASSTPDQDGAHELLILMILMTHIRVKSSSDEDVRK